MFKKLFFLFVGVFVSFVFLSQVLSQEPKLNLETQGNEIRCTVDGKPLFVYRTSSDSYENLAENEYKTYLSELYTPEGRNILRDSPLDHVHHHALMFAITADDVNFWEERGKDKSGVQWERSSFASFSSRESRNDNGSRQWSCQAGFSRFVDWYKPNKENVLLESRDIRATLASDLDATLLDWTSVLFMAPDRESVKLSGTHYHGLGMRFDETMDKNGKFFCDPDSTIASDNVRGDEKKTPCKWIAYTAELHGKPVTVAVFDAPNNPRPMSAFTMGESGQVFAYISATVDLEKEPIVMEDGTTPLVFRYGVAVWEGKRSTEEVEKVYRFWLDQLNRAFSL
ncbi:MAG: PmoA family protein [Planctomycetaceae bacterium]|nr:PmoA family protein [Planctomycetaceae bacterium]